MAAAPSGLFDELKNQWGWAGFTTRDLARCQLMARFIALVYNWWNLFVRLAEPDKHLEAITSRPLLLSAIAERSRHARQTTLRVASSHAKAGWAASVLSGIARFLRELIQSAEQLTAVGAGADRRPRSPILARRAPAPSSAAPYGAGLTQDKPRINRAVRERQVYFLELVAGIIAPQDGAIDVLGTDIARLRGAARDRFRAEHFGIIFQMFNLLPYGSVMDNVVLPLSFSAGGGNVRSAPEAFMPRRGGLLDSLGLEQG